MKQWDPEYYDNNSCVQYHTSMQILESLHLTGNEKILDIGSGSGSITYQISKRLPSGSVLGLDLSTAMTEYAILNYQAPNLEFVTEDVTKMNFKNKFDLVVSFWTLSWVSDQETALKNIVNSLKENGQMHLMYPLRHDIYDVIDDVVKSNKWKQSFCDLPPPRPFFTQEAYTLMLEKFNLRNTSVKKNIIGSSGIPVVCPNLAQANWA